MRNSTAVTGRSLYIWTMTDMSVQRFA